MAIVFAGAYSKVYRLAHYDTKPRLHRQSIQQRQNVKSIATQYPMWKLWKLHLSNSFLRIIWQICALDQFPKAWQPCNIPMCIEKLVALKLVYAHSAH